MKQLSFYVLCLFHSVSTICLDAEKIQKKKMWVFWVTNSETGGFKIVCLVLIILLHIFSAGKIRARVLLYWFVYCLNIWWGWWVRSKSNQYPNTSLIQIEGVNTKEEVGWYAGKRMAYIYKAKVKKNGSHYRCIWGKVARPHGNSGVVRAKFTSNLPPKSMVMWRSYCCWYR